MDETFGAYPTLIRLTGARTYTLRNAPMTAPPEPPARTGLDPNSPRHGPTPYELAVQSTRTPQETPVEGAEGGLEVRFAGGTVEISGEAMSQSLARTESRADEAAEADGGTRPDDASLSSPSHDVHSDLGERVS